MEKLAKVLARLLGTRNIVVVGHLDRLIHVDHLFILKCLSRLVQDHIVMLMMMPQVRLHAPVRIIQSRFVLDQQVENLQRIHQPEPHQMLHR